MGALVVGDRCARVVGAVDAVDGPDGVGVDGEPLVLDVSDSLVNGLAGGNDDDGVSGVGGGAPVETGVSNGLDGDGACSDRARDGSERAVGSEPGPAGLLEWWVSGAPSPSWRVELGAERTVRRELTKGERWAGAAPAVAALGAGVGSGLVKGTAASGSEASVRAVVAAAGVWSRSIRPAGAAPSVRADRWAPGTTVMAALGRSPVMALGLAGLGAVLAAARLGTLGSGSGEALSAASGQSGKLSSLSLRGERRGRRAISAERPYPAFGPSDDTGRLEPEGCTCGARLPPRATGSMTGGRPRPPLRPRPKRGSAVRSGGPLRPFGGARSRHSSSGARWTGGAAGAGRFDADDCSLDPGRSGFCHGQRSRTG